MKEGMEYHCQMVKAYQFLGLWGYAKCQEYHHFEEELGYQEFQKYYAQHYFRMLEISALNIPEVIPEAWYKYSAQAVDVSTKRKAIKDLMTKWVEWEKNTKKLYEEMYLELTNLKEVAASIKVQEYIQDVDEELSEIQMELLNLEAIEYDLSLIIDWQDKLEKKYQKSIKALF